ncbi:MAG: hypothetical protein ABI882_13860 [Acidobacteriota bacterium]
MDFLQGWHDYFVANSLKGSDISWTEHAQLTGREKRCIERSIAAFQLGEYSEGKGLLRAAELFAPEVPSEYLVRITRLFISEEQNHAMLLGKFMTIHNIELIKTHWADIVFRRLRKAVGFELSITVLITAEIISLIYYQALRASSNSTQLKQICNRILADEVKHVRYESELIDHIRFGRSRIYRATVRLLHAFLFLGTTMVVYWSHRDVLNMGGYGLIEFHQQCWREFAAAFSPKTPANGSCGARHARRREPRDA